MDTAPTVEEAASPAVASAIRTPIWRSRLTFRLAVFFGALAIQGWAAYGRYAPNRWLYRDGSFYFNTVRGLTEHGSLDQSHIHPRTWFNGSLGWNYNLTDDWSNVSVGRGSETPFEVFGAGSSPATKDSPAESAWFDGKAVAAYLTARRIPGVRFEATRFAVAEDASHYPYHGQTIEGVRLTVTDRAALDSPELGIEVLSALHHLYPAQFKLDKAAGLVANAETMAALERGDDPKAIAASWAKELDAFKARRAKYLLYP